MRRSDGITHQIFPDHNVMISEENTHKKNQKTKTVI